MLYSQDSRSRPVRGRIAVVTIIVSLLVVGVVSGVSASIDTERACPDPPNAGFLDISAFPRHVRDAINCLADYDITEGTTSTTFSPEMEVSRWQMALFLIRQAEMHGIDLPSGTDRGFVDIDELPLTTQRAINRLVRLDISQGTTATTFSPFDPVPRWQMALFITRLLDAAGMGLPSGASQGFDDIGVLPSATERAINQLAQLDISEGTARNEFSPYSNVSRWQMALFLTRALEADRIEPPAPRRPAPAPSGAPDLERVSFDDEQSDKTQLLYRFDEPVVVDNENDFLLVGWNGDLITALDADRSEDNSDTVEVVFYTEDYDNAVVAAVRSGAVYDIDRHANTMGSYALNNVSVDSVDWPDDYPELVDVDDYDEDDKTVVFEFDQDIVAGTAAGDEASFYLVEEGEAADYIHTGTAVSDDDGDEFIVVEFSDLSQSDWNDVVRAFVEEDVLTGDETNDGNLPNAVDVSNSGRSDTPYITGIDLDDIDDGVVVFTFNQGLTTFENESDNFRLVLHDGTILESTDEDRDLDDTRDVIVTFEGGAMPASDIVIYATVLDGGVTGFTTDACGPDTYVVSPDFNRGDTAGPDLTSSKGSVPSLSEESFTILLTFDEDVDEAFVGSTILGWDEDGDVYDLSAWDDIDIDGDEVELLYETDSSELDALIDEEIVRFGIPGEDVYDDFGFSSHPDGVGCNCAK
ncbi:MAG: S-layer homology domain-containing protein [Acidimicrobiia bacterium]|nr:S-layer homology domain-containing protein [Acidimicrobiia bacterium]